MEVQIHLPRKTEAELTPEMRVDLKIRPKFYKRVGLVPIFYFTTIDGHGEEERHVLQVNAQTKKVSVERMVEVTPACNELRVPKEKNDGGKTDNAPSQD
jgi:hypothetical protein